MKSVKNLKMFGHCRIFGFSFSGVTFAPSKQTAKNHNAANFRTAQNASSQPQLPSSSSSSSLGLFFIAFNILNIMKEVAFLPIYQTLHTNQQKVTLPLRVPSGKGEANSFNLSLPSLERFEHPVDDLKPILQFVMRSTLYVNLMHAVGIYGHNLLFGGRLVRLMAAVPRASPENAFFQEERESRSLALKLFRYLFLLLLLLNAFSLNAYSGHLFWAVISWHLGFGGSFRPTQQQWQELASLAFVTTLHLSLHTVACLTPILFLYIMATFRRHIGALKRGFQQQQQQKSAMNEAALLRLKGQIEQLSAHFHLVIGNQAFPLTLTIVTDIWTMVGTFCFLMVRQDNNTDDSSVGEHQMTYVFNFAVLTFARLCVVCSAGNAATNAYSSLLRALFQRMSAAGSGSHWTLDQWLYFREIKLLKQQFKVVIGAGTYCIKQSALLSVLAFSLNYVVVLLQTQEFGNNSPKKTS